MSEQRNTPAGGASGLEMEEDLEDLFENAPCGYISARPDGRVTKVNRTLAAWLDYGHGGGPGQETGPDKEELVGRRFQDLLTISGKIYYETHFAPLLRMQGFYNEVALDLIGKGGQVLPVLVNAVERRDAAGQVRFIRVTVFNASDRRRYERELLEARRAAEAAGNVVRELNRTLEARIAEAVEQRMEAEEALRQALKMEAIGQLTGGIAHDFNNLLAGIAGSLELLDARIAQGRLDGIGRYVNSARGAARRAATLTHRLLAFARRQALDPRPTNLDGLVAGMEELIRRSMGQEIEIRTVPTPGLWDTLVDPNQLENALLNLCINARDAMPAGGTLTVATANATLDEAAARDHGLPAGQYVALSVADTGSGMPPEVVRRAFDPFFTTKPVGKGTGLGLSMIHGFVRQSGGQVGISSEMGRGTEVCLYFSRHHVTEEAGAGAVPEAVAPEAPTPLPAGAGETVLVVDDEPSVRMLVAEVLEELGYVPIEAVDGPSGLDVLRSEARVDLLVTDVALPGDMDGRQLADAARGLRPDLRVLFITGYAEGTLFGSHRPAQDVQLITKPFTMRTLATRVRELLSQG